MKLIRALAKHRSYFGRLRKRREHPRCIHADTPSAEPVFEPGIRRESFPDALAGGQIHDLPPEPTAAMHPIGRGNGHIYGHIERKCESNRFHPICTLPDRQCEKMPQRELFSSCGIEKTMAIFDEQSSSFLVVRTAGSPPRKEPQMLASSAMARKRMAVDFMKRDPEGLVRPMEYTRSNDDESVARRRSAHEIGADEDADRNPELGGKPPNPRDEAPWLAFVIGGDAFPNRFSLLADPAPCTRFRSHAPNGPIHGEPRRRAQGEIPAAHGLCDASFGAELRGSICIERRPGALGLERLSSAIQGADEWTEVRRRTVSPLGSRGATC